MIVLPALGLIGYIALLVFARRHHRRTWGDGPRSQEARHEFEPDLSLGRGDDGGRETSAATGLPS